MEKYLDTIELTDPIKFTGKVIGVKGLLIESAGPVAVIGELCKIYIPRYQKYIFAEVVGLQNKIVQLMTFEATDGLEIGCPVIASGEMLSVPVSEKLLGRVLDCRGKPIDGKGDISSAIRYSAQGSAPNALERKRITKRMVTGIKAIDALLPVGKGQRIGIFAGSGVGKSTLLGMIARNTLADINVIALIGERGREVREFIENDLGKEGLERSVIIVSTSDNLPLARLKGAYVAMSVAEYFRDQGADVMLLFDSVTRFARAQREIGLSIGEPPTTRGYTPSVFDTLPKLLERAGTSEKGSITGFFTILVDGDDMDEPISDAVRGILDGHFVLTRKLAERYQYPAIDVLKSITRLVTSVTGPQTQKAIGIVRRYMAVYEEAEDMIAIGAYVKGSNPEIDTAIEKRPKILALLQQQITEKIPFGETIKALGSLAGIEIPHSELEQFMDQTTAFDTAKMLERRDKGKTDL